MIMIRLFSFSILQLFSFSMIWAQPSYMIESLPLNKSYTNEIFAVSCENGVIFCSDRRTQVLVSRVDSFNHPLFQLFYVSKKDSAKWGIPQLLSKSLPVKAHYASCTLSADGKEMYFASNDETGQRIYTAKKSGDEWKNIKPFTHNRSKFTTTHPSLSRDGKRLFFASDMPGGFGGFDIYVCEWSPRGGWGTPKNLGPNVNTSGNELYPFIQENGELFFSSSAHGSMGGLDIFSVREVGGVWGTPQQMEEPVNSTGDDISYTAAAADGTTGYFASNRDGKNFNIYSFKSLFPSFADCREQEENSYTYIFEETMASGLDTTFLRLMWDMGDGTVKYGEYVKHTYASTGQYDIYINVVDSLTGEIEHQVAEYTLDVLDEEQPYITVGETLKAGTSLSFDASKTNLPDLDIEEYYWMFGDGTRTKGLYAVHVYAVPGVYRLHLGVIGKSKYTGNREKICVYREIVVE